MIRGNARSGHNSGGFARRTRRLPASHDAEIVERLARLESAVATLVQAQAEGAPALTEAVERLDKQLARAGREQFKANALAEAQQKSLETARAQLQEAAAQNERELTQLRERVTTANDEGRIDVIRRFFPALDGLDEALASGQRLRQTAVAPPASPPSFWERLTGAKRPADVIDRSSEEAIAAWLEGLSFVRERLLAALAADNVLPIRTEGCAFDPHQHLAVETAPATDQMRPGVIVREHRRGYQRGDMVLRYAEVVVARSPLETSASLETLS